MEASSSSKLLFPKPVSSKEALRRPLQHIESELELVWQVIYSIGYLLFVCMGEKQYCTYFNQDALEE